jgi:hypothetical protein
MSYIDAMSYRDSEELRDPVNYGNPEEELVMCQKSYQLEVQIS